MASDMSKDIPEGAYVTNRELYQEISNIQGSITKLWIAVTAVGGVNASALLKSFGGPDVVSLSTSFIGGLF
jgi:hypothetical protein